MCGIAGIFNRNREPVAEPDLARMIAQLHHRGPDGVGYYRDGALGLAHARLSIIDLAGGAQPMHNEDRSVWVAFNGEIFNYVELRQDLVRAGHVFATHSDTEVIVHLYEEHGDDFVRHLNGQFAIALWDARAKRLVLTRDRAGILPLYYQRTAERVLFASEVKAILAATGRPPRMNPAALDQLMTLWSPVKPETVFEGIEEVLPGEMLVVDDGGLRRHGYWDWVFPEDPADYHRGSEDDLAAELYELLVDATRIRLRADVPVGAYLSGGLDSSALVALIHGHGDGVRLRTFSIGFEDKGFDEESYQNDMIRHTGADHSRILCANADIAARFPDVVWHAESPMLRTAPAPMCLLSGLVREQGYKVVLTGEGSDEVLGGYDIFKEAKIRHFWARYPQSRRRPLLLQRLYPYLNLPGDRAPAYLKEFFGIGLERPERPGFSHLPRWSTTARCKDFLAPELRAASGAAEERLEATLPAALGRWHPFNRAQYIEAKSLMAGYLLASQGDRMLMANSVEGRFPFLDHRVIEFANRLPPRFKMKVLNEKYLLKKAMRPHLPASVVDRYKQPYRAPDIPSFFGANDPDYLDLVLSERALKDYGYFDAARVGLLIRKIRAGRAIGYKDNMALVGILSTQLWHHLFVERYRENFMDSPTSSRLARAGGDPSGS